MLMEIITPTIEVIDNTIKITPADGIADNYIYEIKLKGLKELNGTKVLDNETVTFCTELTPAYATIDAVNSLIASCNVEDIVILYHIREASKFVDYIKGSAYKSTVPFEVEQFVKYKAAQECVLRFYVERASKGSQKGAIGDVSFDTQSGLPDISALLKELKKETATWQDAVRGFKLEGRVKPLSAIKASNITTTRPSNQPAPSRSDWSGG